MEKVLEIIGQISNFAGAIGGIVSAIGVVRILYLKNRETNPIKVFFVTEENKKIPLRMFLIRKDISRPEIMGRLGMLPVKEKSGRFQIKGLLSKEVLEGINNVTEGKASELFIPITKLELEQFEF